MNIFFILLVVFSFLYYIYESYVAPTIKYGLRFELFALRDELRRVEILSVDKINHELYDFMEAAISESISRLDDFNIANIIKVQYEKKKSKNFIQKYRKKIEMLDSCEIVEIKSIDKKIGTISLKAFLVNSGGWVIFLLPVIVFTIIVDLIINRVYKFVRSSGRKFFYYEMTTNNLNGMTVVH